MRRVTDSVSGLLGSSWIPGFLRGDEGQNEEAGPSGYSRGAASNLPPSPRSLHPIYPEEAGSEEQGDNSAVTSIAASAANNSNHRINFSASGHSSSAVLASGPTTSERDGTAVHSSLMLGDSSAVAPDQTISDRYKSTGNTSTGVKSYATTPPHVGKLTYTTPRPVDAAPSSQRQAEVQSSRRTADCLSEEQPPCVSQCPAVPSFSALSSRLSTQGDSSESTELITSARLSAAQSASKRPRFSLAAYSAAASPPGNKSILSDGSFRSSPFYPGRTIYGGAASYRRTPTPVSSSRASTASPRPGSDGGLSEAAKKILTCLNAMSTPLTDAKRIPTPAASPYASYLDSPYTAAFHRHRPQQRRPPTASICTPAKASVQSNFTQYVMPRPAPGAAMTSSSSSRVPELLPVSASHDHGVLNPSSSLNPTDEQPSIFSVAAASAAPRSPASSLKSKSSTESNSSLLLQADKPRLEASNTAVPSARSPPSSATGVTSFPSTSSVAVPSVSSPCANPLRRQESTLSWPYVDEVAAAGGGKMKTSFKPRHNRNEAEPVYDLPNDPVPLPNVSLPKVNFSVPIPLSGMMKPPTRESTGTCSSREGFEFRAPEVLHHPASKQKESSASTNAGSSSNCSEDSTALLFNFSAPVSVITDQSSKENFVVPKPSFVPKLKTVSPVKIITSEATRELVPSSSGLLEFLNKSSGKSPQSVVTSKESNPSSTSEKSCSEGGFKGFGDRFKAAAGSWECDTCMVRNNADKSRCVACDTAKPGSGSSPVKSSDAVSNSKAASVSSTTAPAFITNSKPTVSGFGDAFKKAASDWECDTCLVNNKGDALQCIACQTAKPGASSSASASNPVSIGANSKESSSTCFSFGVPATSAVTTTVTSTFSFGTKPSSTVASSSSSGFSFGTKLSSTVAACSSSSSTFSFGLKPSSTISQTTSPFSFGVASSSSVPSSSSTSTSSVTFSGFSAASTIATTSAGSNFSSMASGKTEAAAKTTTSSDSTPASTKSPNDWECSSCSRRNTSESCTSCDAPKPGLKSSTSSDMNTSCTSLPPTGFGDKFKKSIGDWACGVCMVTNKAGAEKCVSCEASKPSVSGSVKSSLGGTYKFGSSSKTTDDSGFKFGLTAPNTATASPVSEAPKTCVTSANFSFVVPSVSSSVPAAPSFGVSASNPVVLAAAASDKPLFTFGTQPNSTSNGSIHGQGPPASLKFLTSSNETVSTVKTPSASHEFKTISQVSSVPATDSSFKKSNTNMFSFGAPANKNDGLVVAPPAKAPSYSPSVPDANKSSGFFNSTPVMNSSDQVKTSNKRSLNSDDCDLQNKISNSRFSKNNGFAEPSAQFSFAKSASAVTPSFQFNSSNNSAPAFGNFSACFGGSASAGSVFQGVNNNNNNNISDGLKGGAAPTPTFAFGQPAEKKASTGFDFGQAATPAPAFNFAAASPASFQFGQASSAKTAGGGGGATNNGVFQFGSSAATGATPSFGGGPGNPFSPTPSALPPRLVKRAIRRTKK
ncbi:Zinc finger RanBP2-type [Trinorchestia longiramus]|nr:Zinc finger RanBP2-type [Trinorchestia longiramus]